MSASTMDADAILRELSSPARRLGTAALAVLVATGALVAWTSLPLFGLIGVSAGAPPKAISDEALVKRTDEFKGLLARAQDAVAAREPFGKTRVAARPAPGPSKPSVPSRYGGPTMIAMVENTAWFSDGRKVRVGESTDGSGGLSVLSLEPPWNARVKWMGGEFTVSLFDRDVARWSQPLSVWHNSGPAASAAAAAAAAPKPGTPAPGTLAGAAAAAPGGPGAVQAAPGGPALPAGAQQIKLPDGVVIESPVIIQRSEGGSTIVVASPPPGAAPPPPPPPDGDEKH